jgi:hypothetical protein
LFAAASKSTLVSVSIKPEVVLSTEGASAVTVRIRLSPSASARLWIAESCTDDAGAGYMLTQSGEYHILLSALRGTGGVACLISASDGLNAETRLAPK